MLDAFGNLGVPRRRGAELAQSLRRLREESSEWNVDERSHAQQVDLLRFQAQEISRARLSPDEEEPLKEELSRASNASQLLQLSRTAIELLSEGEQSLLIQAGQLGRALQECGRLDPRAQDIQDLHVQSVSLLQELSDALSHYHERLDLDPARLAELEDRLSLIQSLKRKYGSSLAEVIEFGANAAEKLRRLESREEEVARLRAKIQAAEQALWEAAAALSRERAKVAPRLCREVSRQLQELGFQQSQFECSLRTLEKGEFLAAARASGIDGLDFQFAPNPGEPAQPLKAIASSGEMARVMLAVKTVLAAEDEVPVLVFDEVDANVGGETAKVVGQKMAQIAKKRQVLCITHLAPVAASASAHYLVSKQVKNGRTLSEIDRLGGDDRVKEIARMLGGQSTAARQHAEELLR
ncbi:MAG: DNA repair protein RecN [Verrucomicrobia bacterium]|nr:DNA repair protein RecN [Verrucomicrobiota bacterium]